MEITQPQIKRYYVWISVAAIKLKVSRRHIRRLINQGKLQAIRPTVRTTKVCVTCLTGQEQEPIDCSSCINFPPKKP